MDTILAQVRDFADQAHGTQKRKYTPERYIVHPVRVMELCSRYDNSRPTLAAALLHDVLEDTEVDEGGMLRYLQSVMDGADAEQTTALVVELTDVYTKQRFPRLNRKKRKRKEAERIEKTSSTSQTIKYADIIDNCKEIARHDPEFAPVFLRECRMLLERMPHGHPELRNKAIEVVETEIAQLRR